MREREVTEYVPIDAAIIKPYYNLWGRRRHIAKYQTQNMCRMMDPHIPENYTELSGLNEHR